MSGGTVGRQRVGMPINLCRTKSCAMSPADTPTHGVGCRPWRLDLPTTVGPERRRHARCGLNT